VVAVDAERFNPDLYSVSGLQEAFTGPGPPVRTLPSHPFANSVVTVSSAFPAAGLIEVPHELGHALFNLSDEYVGRVSGFDGRTDLSSWPTCAEDDAEAASWWGDLEGAVDPMVTTWASEMESAGFLLVDTDVLRERVRVTAVDGGCYGVPGSYRATEDSLMNTSIPVLGSVNRRWAEQVLDLWTGAERP
ncbi:MAG: hypothetical protein ACR2QO_11655, partial [Acidimicrobiales bacterium]